MFMVALVITSFVIGRFFAENSLTEENRKLRESVRLLRGEKLDSDQAKSDLRPWSAQAESPKPTPITAVDDDSKTQTPLTAPSAIPRTALNKPATQTITEETIAPESTVEPEATTAPAPPAASPTSSKKTSKKWVSDFGNGVQGTVTYWRCNNATLVAGGMEYYAYGSIPANRLTKPEQAYSVRDGRAIVIAGCWSPRLDRAILYRKSDGHRWEPAIKLDDGSWSIEAN
jgi:hypothetical protein